MLDAPRWPRSADAPWPPPPLLDGLVPGAGKLVEQADRVRAQARAALTDLTDHRPGGAGWDAARAADRDQPAPRGKWQIERLLEADPGRYARALALCSTVSARLDELRGRLASDALVDAVDSRLAELRHTAGVAAQRALDAARAGDKAVAWTSLREVDDVGVEARPLTGLRRWLVGEDAAFDRAAVWTVARVTVDALQDAREELDGVPVEQRRKAREVARLQRANFAAVAEGRPAPYPEVARGQHEQLAGLRSASTAGAVL